MIMTTRLRKSALALAMLAFIFDLVVLNTCVASPASSVQVDVFTQKHPYSGRGHNMPSDAFGPQDIVILYAEVLKDGNPLDNVLVAFNVQTPNGANFSISSTTNMSGIATVNFTIATPPINISETDVFGYWTVLGTVLYAGQVFSDTLTFRVDWVVKLLTVRTIDENLSSQSSFGNGGDVGLEITLRSIAKILTNATISIVVKDELDFTVNFSLIADFAVQPNEKLLYIYSKAILPKGAHIGSAKVIVSAFTAPVSEGGVPFCPSIEADFYISPVNPLVIDLHDVAIVAVLPSANPLEFGQGLTLTTLVRNEGTVNESFNVSTYFDGVLLGIGKVINLPPYATMTFYYAVNLSMLTVGDHTISGSIPPVPKEADLTDNYFVDTVEVLPTLQAPIDDIAITSITLSSNSVFIGETIGINVSVANNGTESETFDLSVYDNSSLIETRQVIELAPSAQETLAFTWNTSSVSPGFYRISADAPLPGDPTPWDNILVDGIVEIKSSVPPQPYFPTLAMLVFSIIVALAVLAGLIFLFLILCLDRIRRKRKRPRPTYVVIVHPHV
jgi:hypothetical protein